MVVRRVGVWVGKESEAGLLVLGLGEAVKLLLHHFGVSASFLASPSAPIWLIAIGVLGGLGWVFWLPRHASPPTQDASAPQNTDEINELKRKITDQRDEVYQANAARDLIRSERDALKGQVQDLTRQVETAQSEWRMVHRELAETTPKAEVVEIVKERESLRKEAAELRAAETENKAVLEAHERLKPMLTMRDRLLEMIGKLFLFQVEMDRSDAQAHSTPRSAVDEWVDSTNLARIDFDQKYRGQLVKLAADLKLHYGFVHSGLTDEVLALDVYGQAQIEKYLSALKDVTSRLDEQILDLVTKKTSLGERQ